MKPLVRLPVPDWRIMEWSGLWGIPVSNGQRKKLVISELTKMASDPETDRLHRLDHGESASEALGKVVSGRYDFEFGISSEEKK